MLWLVMGQWPFIFRTPYLHSFIHFFGPFTKHTLVISLSYSGVIINWVLVSSHTFPISSAHDSRCTPQFCYLRKSSALLTYRWCYGQARVYWVNPRHPPFLLLPLMALIPVFGLVCPDEAVQVSRFIIGLWLSYRYYF